MKKEHFYAVFYCFLSVLGLLWAGTHYAGQRSMIMLFVAGIPIAAIVLLVVIDDMGEQRRR